MTKSADILSLRQRKLFSILEKFFKKASGGGIEKVPSNTTFADWVHQNTQKLLKLGTDAFPWVYENLINYYEDSRKNSSFHIARELGGMKLVLGGTSHFTIIQLKSVQKMLLYADTILIPDPILPWIESYRAEERYRDVLFLEQAYILLHLKPLVDADLVYPAIVIFPSWEKSLEDKDPQTKAGQSKLITDVISNYTKISFEDLDQIKGFASQRSNDFLRLVDTNRLFIGPGGDIGEPLTTAINRYKDNIKTWRSVEYQKHLSKIPDSMLVLLAIIERIGPLFHLFENAEELIANPMFCLPVHWYYYNLCTRFFQERLEQLSLFDTKSLAEIRALNSKQLEWLGDIPIETIVELRKRGENEQFRKHLKLYTDNLNNASLENLNQVAAEVNRSISTLIINHQNEIRRIQEKYNRKAIRTILLAGVTGAVTLIPALAPLVGGAILAPSGKFVWDMISKGFDKQQAARSLMGVMAAAETKVKK